MNTNDLKIRRVFYDERGKYNHIKECYGYEYCRVYYALYTDHSWEEIAAIDWYNTECEKSKGKPNIQLRIIDKTRSDAIKIINDLIESGKLNGKLIINELSQQ